MWRCPQCGEQVDDDFEICWNCESPREKGEDPTIRSTFREVSHIKDEASRLEAQFKDSNFVGYHASLLEAQELRERNFQIAERILGERIAAIERESSRKESDNNNKISQLKREVSEIRNDVLEWNAGCFTFGALWIVYFFIGLALGLYGMGTRNSPIGILSTFVVPFLIPYLWNKANRLLAESNARLKEREIKPKIERLEAEARKSREVAEEKINTLQLLLSKCKQRQPI